MNEENVYLLFRETGLYEDATTTVVAVLTDEHQAELLMQARTRIENTDSVNYWIEPCPIHPTAASALGVE